MPSILHFIHSVFLSLSISHCHFGYLTDRARDMKKYTHLYYPIFYFICNYLLSLFPCISSCIYLFYLFILFYSIYILYFLPFITRLYILSYFLVSFSLIYSVFLLCITFLLFSDAYIPSLFQQFILTVKYLELLIVLSIP